MHIPGKLALLVIWLTAVCTAVVAAPHDATDLSRVTFTHPGLLNSKAELDFIRDKIRCRAEPWSSLFTQMQHSRFANPAWEPRALTTVDARSEDANIEIDDATAAYTLALLWYFTGDETYARPATAILNAWSSKLVSHTSNDLQKQLLAGWCGSLFPLAGEILRASYPQWSRDEIGRFSAMLDRAFLPLLMDGNSTYNGNWELTMTDALVSIGVFNEDAKAFKRGISLWRKRVPAYFYLRSDGAEPLRPAAAPALASSSALRHYWYEPHEYFDGLCQETCRDYGHHTQEGLASVINVAEIAYHQGFDLYAENETRIIAAMEFQATRFRGDPVPTELFPRGFVCSDLLPTWEIAYNHYHNRRHCTLPATRELIQTKLRNPDSITTHNNIAWEGLLHADLDVEERLSLPALK